MNRTFLAMWLGLLPWGAAGADEQLPPNTWMRVEIDWPTVLAREVEDGRPVTTDGYSDNVLRTKTGEVLIRTGLESKTLGTSPGFYTNTTVAWKVADDGICYVPQQDAMYQMLGANWRVGGRGAEEDAKRQLEIDNRSTWRYDFASGRWQRIDHNVWKFFKTSPYESHLTHWPEGGKLLFLDDGGNHYAEFDLKTQRWQQQELAGAGPGVPRGDPWFSDRAVSDRQPVCRQRDVSQAGHCLRGPPSDHRHLHRPPCQNRADGVNLRNVGEASMRRKACDRTPLS